MKREGCKYICYKANNAKRMGVNKYNGERKTSVAREIRKNREDENLELGAVKDKLGFLEEKIHTLIGTMSWAQRIQMGEERQRKEMGSLSQIQQSQGHQNPQYGRTTERMY